MAKANDDQQGKRRTQSHSRRFLPIATAVLTVAVIGALAFWGLRYVQDSSYQDERAFRVLGQIAGQFSNFQEAISGAAGLAPAGEAARDEIDRYLGRLSLTRADLRACTPSESGARDPAQFEIDATDQQRKFSWRNVDEKKTCRILAGRLGEQQSTFFAQDFFDAAIIAGRDGTTIATLARQGDASPIVELHEASGPELIGGNAKALLSSPASADKKPPSNATAQDNKTASEAPAEPPLQATVYDAKLGGESFRVFVLPFQPLHAVTIDARPQPRLYLIGLKKQDYIESLSDTLGTTGALVVTIGVLLLVLAWPIVSLRFSSPQEAISRAQLLAFIIALLLIPAVIATAGFAVWTRYRLTLWADQQAESYSQRVERALIHELDADVHVLEEVSQAVKQKPQVVAGNFNTEDRADCADGKGDCELQLKLTAQNTSLKWSPLRSVTVVNAAGESRGLTFGFFAEPEDPHLHLEDREYFQALKNVGEWRPTNMWHRATHARGADDHPYVAQRLFNRTDAARVLQVSVPIDTVDGKRLGIVTGDTRVYGLTASIRVPLLRFAIIDSRTGTLLFHTDDRLSLAENFVVETEGNEALQEAMARRASERSQDRILSSQHFDGRYLGAPHRFFLRPLAGAPWSLAIFYPRSAIDSIVMQTTIATLATFFAFFIIAMLSLLLLVLILPARADLALMKRLWPQWVMRDRYPIVGLALLTLLATIAFVAIGRLNRWTWLAEASWSVLIVLCLLATAALVALVHRIKSRWWTAASSTASISAYRRGYVTCTLALLCLISTYPAIWLGIGYHDTAVRAFMREELQDAAADAEKRRLVLQRDVRRFTFSDSQTPRNYSAAALSKDLPVPGYEFRRSAELPSGAAWVVSDIEPTPWLARCGPPSLGWVRRYIWTMSTARHVRVNRSSTENTLGGGGEAGSFKGVAPEQEPARMDADDCRLVMTRGRLRSESGNDHSVALTRASIVPIGADSFSTCRADCRDEDLRRIYARGSGIALSGIALMCLLLLLVVAAYTARWVFGIRVPFAGRFTPIERDPADVSQLLDLELELIALKSSSAVPMSRKDEADWRAVKCRPVFERMWKSLSTREQLLLHQLARGNYANPANQTVIEQLLRRGFLKLAPWPRIAEPGFAEFICTVEHDEFFDTLQYETSHTLWSQVRTPLLILVIVVAGLLMWLAGSTMQLVAGALAGVAALFGSVSQVTNFIHRDKPPSS